MKNLPWPSSPTPWTADRTPSPTAWRIKWWTFTCRTNLPPGHCQHERFAKSYDALTGRYEFEGAKSPFLSLSGCTNRGLMAQDGKLHKIKGSNDAAPDYR